jgi:carbamate kinase
VLADDPAFTHPTKFVGEVYDKAEADRLATARGWPFARTASTGAGVVGSPQPRRVVETRLIRLLLNSGAIVVCAGGGGVPVVRDERGQLRGVEAVVDKDLTAAMLAEALDADILLILSDVANVVEGWGTPDPRPIRNITPVALRRGDSAAGTMGPKVDAVCRFVEVTADMGAIGRLEDAVDIVAGKAGTIVTPAGEYGGLEDLTPNPT